MLAKAAVRGLLLVFSLVVLFSFSGCKQKAASLSSTSGQKFEDDGIVLQKSESLAGSRILWKTEDHLFTTVDCQDIRLDKFLVDIDTDGRWLIGAEILPKGKYQITVKQLPATSAYLKQHFYHVLEESFGIKTTETNKAIPGYRFKVPAPLPSVFKQSTHTSRSGGTSAVGYRFEGYTISDLTDWLESELQMPIECEHAPEESRYDFELAYDAFDPKTAIDALSKLGFVLEKANLLRPVVEFEKVAPHNDR